MPPQVLVLWRFYGHELYSIHANKYLSQFTLCASKKVFIKVAFQDLRGKASTLLSKIKWGHYLQTDMNRVLTRINFFLGYSNEEYEYLKGIFQDLPPFLRLSIDHPGDFSYNKSEVEKNRIIVGNSKSMYNNHLDIFEIVKSNSKLENCEIVIPFNYGIDSNYSMQVYKEGSKIKGVQFLTKVLTYSEYNNLFYKSHALVINSYKQLALGNIFMAIRNGLKIYLSGKNEILYWLRNNNLIISTIEDFKEDFPRGNTKLTLAEAKINYDSFLNMSKSFNKEAFKGALKECLMEKK